MTGTEVAGTTEKKVVRTMIAITAITIATATGAITGMIMVAEINGKVVCGTSGAEF